MTNCYLFDLQITQFGRMKNIKSCQNGFWVYENEKLMCNMAHLNLKEGIHLKYFSIAS